MKYIFQILEKIVEEWSRSPSKLMVIDIGKLEVEHEEWKSGWELILIVWM